MTDLRSVIARVNVHGIRLGQVAIVDVDHPFWKGNLEAGYIVLKEPTTDGTVVLADVEPEPPEVDVDEPTAVSKSRKKSDGELPA